MGTLAQEYLRKMQGFATREEIAKEVDAAVAQVMVSKVPAGSKVTPAAGNIAEADLDKIIKEELSKLTASDLAAVEDSLDEAKTTYPKDKQIKAMKALIKKLTSKYRASRDSTLGLSFKVQRNTKKKGDSPETPAMTKKRRAAKADAKKVLAAAAEKQKKAMDIIKRARVQLDRLVADRKSYNKKNRATKKAA